MLPGDQVQKWKKAHVEDQVDVRSYAACTCTEDGKVSHRNRRDIKKCYQPPATSMPEVEPENTNMTARPTLLKEQTVKDLGQLPTPQPKQGITDTPSLSPKVLPTVNEPHVREGTVTRSSCHLKPAAHFKDFRMT